MDIFCPAKLNLCLHIVQQRSDGYHELQTAFALLNWGDRLSIQIQPRSDTTSSTETVKINGFEHVELEQNLIYKATKAFEAAYGQPLPPLEFNIEKNIPLGAGLGGGSSNAAGTVLGLNALFKNPLSPGELLQIGAQLGADVPVFINQRHAWAEGIGEQLLPLSLPDMHFILAIPQVSVQTADAFQHPQLQRLNPRLDPPPRPFKLSDYRHNHFESIVRAEFPAVEDCFNHLASFGEPRLSGTGACVFLAFDNQLDASNAFHKLQAMPIPFQLKQTALLYS